MKEERDKLRGEKIPDKKILKRKLMNYKDGLKRSRNITMNFLEMLKKRIVPPFFIIKRLINHLNR
ncbi:MAG: hypothetical protein AB7U40_08255 [Methanobacteriales archaeon]